MSGWDILKLDPIDGQPLTALRDQLSTDERHRIVSTLHGALAYVNGTGILHTDVSSANVLWDGSQPYLIDFEEAKELRSAIRSEDSPDIVGGPPCCWGDVGYGYKTYLCLQSLREWLLQREFSDLKQDLARRGAWNPASVGNTWEPWSTRDDGSIYQSVAFGGDALPGQRAPELRLLYLVTRKKISFSGKVVLDIGCNLGRLGALFEKLGVGHYVGVDVNEDFIDLAAALARLEGRTRSAFVAGDVCSSATFEELKRRSPAGYDVVICQSVYHHFVDKRTFWDKFATLGCRWLVFEGPVHDPKCLMTESWATEKAFLRGLGYTAVHEGTDNDFGWRVVALFEQQSK